MFGEMTEETPRNIKKNDVSYSALAINCNAEDSNYITACYELLSILEQAFFYYGKVTCTCAVSRSIHGTTKDEKTEVRAFVSHKSRAP